MEQRNDGMIERRNDGMIGRRNDETEENHPRS